MARRVMVILGLLAFVVAMVGGLIARNQPETILSRSLEAMGGFCVLGLVIGWAAEHVVREHHQKQREKILGASEKTSSDPGPDHSEKSRKSEAGISSTIV